MLATRLLLVLALLASVTGATGCGDDLGGGACSGLGETACEASASCTFIDCRGCTGGSQTGPVCYANEEVPTEPCGAGCGAPAEGLSCSPSVDDDYVCTGGDEAPLLCTDTGIWETDSACSCDERGGVTCS